jgi:hypothetical protein
MKLNEMNFNEIETKSYRQYFSCGRFYDNVDEYSLISKDSLGIDEFEKALTDAGHYFWGVITLIKKQLTLGGEIIGYRHILKAAMSPN